MAAPMRPRTATWMAVLTVAGGLVAPAALLSWWAGPGAGGFDATTVARPADRATLDAGYPYVPFDRLAVIGDGVGLASIPVDIAVLQGQPIALDGFMLPLDGGSGSVGHFLLTARYDACFFGVSSPIAERVDVTMSRNRMTLLTHQPIRVYGRLSIRPLREGPHLVRLYEMIAEAVDLR